MAAMKRISGIALFLFAAIAASAPLACAQSGVIQFVAGATPSGGLQEPVRGFPFFLLSKSFAAINKDAQASVPEPAMNAFVAKLDVSSALKAWMKKNKRVSLTGEDFIHKLTPSDILGVPEFRKAYMERNAGDESVDFPKPKFKASEAKKNPAKYKKLSDEYEQTLLHYIAMYPQTVEGLDLSLTDVDPGPRWNKLLARRTPEIRRRALDLAQSKYLVARTETNLQGQAAFENIPPGKYWLSTLNLKAEVGDVRLRWDVPVIVKPGSTESVALSNVNSVQPQSPPE